VTVTAAPTALGRFLSDRVSTATPQALLVMLYDRLVVDLTRAETAETGGDRAAAHAALVHAQDILAELLGSLDVEAWDGAPGLAALYAYLLRELVRANVEHDAARTAACRRVVEPLRDAWREAATATG
jgi:flagellar protein FliS